PQVPLRLDQDIFDLSARVFARYLDFVRRVQARRGASVKHRDRRRTLDAVNGELLHMALDGGAVATGPPGQDHLPDLDIGITAATGRDESKRESGHRVRMDRNSGFRGGCSRSGT